MIYVVLSNCHLYCACPFLSIVRCWDFFLPVRIETTISGFWAHVMERNGSVLEHQTLDYKNLG